MLLKKKKNLLFLHLHLFHHMFALPHYNSTKLAAALYFYNNKRVQKFSYLPFISFTNIAMCTLHCSSYKIPFNFSTTPTYIKHHYPYSFSTTCSSKSIFLFLLLLLLLIHSFNIISHDTYNNIPSAVTSLFHIFFSILNPSLFHNMARTLHTGVLLQHAQAVRHLL